MTWTHLRIASMVTSLVALVGFFVGLTDPAYYDPVVFIDWVSASLNTLGPLAAALALFVWWRVTTVRRGAFLILVAAISAAIFGLGNMIEDILDLEWGFLLFGLGGIGTVISAALAGILALTVDSKMRWTGVFLLGVGAGPALDSALVWVIVWIVFAAIPWQTYAIPQGANQANGG